MSYLRYGMAFSSTLVHDVYTLLIVISKMPIYVLCNVIYVYVRCLDILYKKRRSVFYTYVVDLTW